MPRSDDGEKLEFLSPAAASSSRRRCFPPCSPEARGGRLYGPSGLGHLAGAPAEQAVYSRLRSADDAARIWRISEELTGTAFPADEGAHPGPGSTGRP
ncbi:hypothetical protein [Amycolatopsis sp. cmx-4-54]|uniref:hypothetical protein n=1 Tax=Amycolatopsis sp. cmx-4-54 TaxID=2790936 RepID=UPI00397B042D